MEEFMIFKIVDDEQDWPENGGKSIGELAHEDKIYTVAKQKGLLPVDGNEHYKMAFQLT